jgi:hypothetical protein
VSVRVCIALTAALLDSFLPQIPAIPFLGILFKENKQFDAEGRVFVTTGITVPWPKCVASKYCERRGSFLESSHIDLYDFKGRV